MKQKEIKKLLVEASKPKCTQERREEIIELFKNATAFKDPNDEFK